tara:strand:- start:292 stop:1305 length:1014 start_codon:yes stop_codon:yes gene_type:complete
MIILETIFKNIWKNKGVLFILLTPFSILYFIIINFRYFLYKVGLFNKKKINCPIIIVGNIFIGGTGKTPVVIWLVKLFKKNGFRPGVISKGYLSNSKEQKFVTKCMSPMEVGDEPVLICQKTDVPLVIGKNRVDAAEKLISLVPDINLIISDDGLQHYSLARDVEIQILDDRGYGNGWLLPAGPLRELKTRKSDFYLINSQSNFNNSSTNSSVFSLKFFGDRAFQLCNNKNIIELKKISKKLKIIAAAGIGNPNRFFEMLKLQDIRLIKFMPLPDHYNFLENPFKKISADIILITDKDAIKCKYNKQLQNDYRLWVVPIEVYINDSFEKKILEKICG